MKEILHKAKHMFKESILGSNNKIDHKRLTTFFFVIMFAITTVVCLFKKEEIANKALVETILWIDASVIIGGMGLTKLFNKGNTTDLNTTNNATN